MHLVRQVLGLIVLVFFLVLLVRLVLDWVQYFARQWRPSGIALVIAEVTYSITDPPLKALRRIIRPVRIGSVQLDLAFMVLFIACLFLLQVL